MADAKNARPSRLQELLHLLPIRLALEWERDTQRNQELVSDFWPDVEEVVDELAKWIATEWGTPDLDTSEALGRFRAALLAGLDERRSELSGDAARRYAELLTEYELRRVEVQLVQQASRMGRVGQIERRLGHSASGPCPRCIELAGVHPIDFPDLFWEHPNGVCSWHPFGGTAAFAKRSKESVGFEHPARGPHHCGECEHFQNPNGCALVAGEIAPVDWCRLFEPRRVRTFGARVAENLGFASGRTVAMADWDSQEKRNKEPKSTFCGPGTSFPIADCADVSHARSLLHHAAKGNQSSISSCVEGKAKSMSCANADSPDKGKANHSMTKPFAAQIGEFAVPATVGFAGAGRVMDGDMVVRRGKIFGTGVHQPGNLAFPITVTPEHIALIAENSSGEIDINLGHKAAKTDIDGMLGNVRIVEVTPTADIIGETRMPKWLDDAFTEKLGDADIPVSVELNLDELKLSGLALARNQILPDAKIAAAFAASKGITPAVRFAAAKKPAAGAVPMTIHHPSAVHANTVTHGHDHAGMGWHDHEHDHADGSNDHDGDEHLAAHAAGSNAGSDDMLGGGGSKGWSFHYVPQPHAIGYHAQGGKKMSFKDKVTAWFAGGMPDDFDDGGTPTGTSGALSHDPRIAELSARQEAHDRELAGIRSENIKLKAEAWADAEIKALRSMPPDRDSLIASYAEAAADDLGHPVANFADGTVAPTRLERLIEREAKRTPNYLPEDVLPDASDGEKAVAAFANQMETRGRLGPDGKPLTADLAEKDPEAFRNSERYRVLMAASGDVQAEEPTLMGAFSELVEGAVERAISKKK